MEYDQQEETLATPGCLDKYQQAGKISNAVLERVLKKCVPGASIVEICAFGDSEIEKEVAKVYSKKKYEKGVAFPTCVSPNEICGHFSPLASENETLKEGDLVKVDLGVHIDGFVTMVGHTVVVQAQSKVVEGKKADVVLAAYNSIQAALRCLRPGNNNYQVTDIIAKTCQDFQVNPLEGVLSHDVKKFMIDGNNCIINKETFDQKVEEHEFGVHEAYVLDVVVSSGEGKTKESELRTTVYKRALDRNYSLKTKSARLFYSELLNKYPALCFSMRAFDDEITAKLGVKECSEHDLLNFYPVLLEKPGEVVASFKYTVVIMTGGTMQITGLTLDENEYKSENSVKDETVKHFLAQSMNKGAQKTQKKKKDQA